MPSLAKSLSDSSAAALIAYVDAADATKASKRLPGNEQTGATYSIVQGDEDTGVKGNRATAQTFTLDSLAVGTVILVMQKGAGTIEVISGTATRRGGLYKTAGQFKTMLLWYESATEVWVSGEVVA